MAIQILDHVTELAQMAWINFYGVAWSQDILMDLYNFFSSANGHTSTDLAKNDYKDFPTTFDSIWVLGKKYHPLHDLKDLRNLIRSKVWFSYRSGFPAIDGNGPKSDRYWGCMLRCAQMVMANALISRHLGREWLWKSDVTDPVYEEIMRMFQDKKGCPYSIHQIALTGVSQGKTVGQWFGPNTAAQVLRKLSAYDHWSSVAVHVAIDSTVIKSDIRTLCQYMPEPTTPTPYVRSYQTIWYTDCVTRQCARFQSQAAASIEPSSTWRPMLLFIPLRLGLAAFNEVYSQSLKSSFTIKQSMGMLGGKPRHAVWFIGYTGNELVCLDPHVTQPAVNLDTHFNDSSYHIPLGGSKRMPLDEIDPSCALCFFIESKADFEDWCQQVEKVVLNSVKQPLFELLESRPRHWPELDLHPDLNCSSCSLDYCFVEQESTIDASDDDFESLEGMVCVKKPTNS